MWNNTEKRMAELEKERCNEIADRHKMWNEMGRLRGKLVDMEGKVSEIGETGKRLNAACEHMEKLLEGEQVEPLTMAEQVEVMLVEQMTKVKLMGEVREDLGLATDAGRALAELGKAYAAVATARVAAEQTDQLVSDILQAGVEMGIIEPKEDEEPEEAPKEALDAVISLMVELGERMGLALGPEGWVKKAPTEQEGEPEAANPEDKKSGCQNEKTA